MMMAAGSGVGLSEVQLDRLRDQLAAGGKPRVRVSGAQFADQPAGTVLAVGRPEIDGDDFVTVRVKAGGVTDELRFSPRELAPVGRVPAASASDRPGRGGRRSHGPQTGQSQGQQESAAIQIATAAQAQAVARKAAPTKKTARVQPAKAAENPMRRDAAATKKASPASGAAGTSLPAAGTKTAATVPSRRRGPSLPTVSVTLASAGATWSVSAQRGSRTVVKNTPIPPGVVSAVAELLGLPAVADAVAAVNDAALREAEARAAALRAELAALEAELNSHRRP